MSPKLEKTFVEYGHRCSMCGGKISDNSIVYEVGIVKSGLQKQVYLHTDCAPRNHANAVWSYFWQEDSGDLIRIVLFETDRGSWGIYSQMLGRPIFRWGNEFETLELAKNRLENDKVFNRLHEWRECHKETIIAA